MAVNLLWKGCNEIPGETRRLKVISRKYLQPRILRRKDGKLKTNLSFRMFLGLKPSTSIGWTQCHSLLANDQSSSHTERVTLGTHRLPRVASLCTAFWYKLFRSSSRAKATGKAVLIVTRSLQPEVRCEGIIRQKWPLERAANYNSDTTLDMKGKSGSQI